MDTRSVADIVAQYAKHGWKLRRVLLSAEPDDAVRAVAGDAEIVRGRQNALWFSRRSQPDSEAWELRRLEGSPFALVAVIPDEADDDEREETLADTEEEMLHARPAATGH